MKPGRFLRAVGILLATCCLLPGACRAADLERSDDVMRQALERGQLPGAAVLIVHDDAVVFFRKGFGHDDDDAVGFRKAVFRLRPVRFSGSQFAEKANFATRLLYEGLQVNASGSPAYRACNAPPLALADSAAHRARRPGTLPRSAGSVPPARLWATP